MIKGTTNNPAQFRQVAIVGDISDFSAAGSLTVVAASIHAVRLQQ